MKLSDLKMKIEQILSDIGDAEVGVSGASFDAQSDAYYDFFIQCHHCNTSHPLAVLSPIHPDYMWDTEKKEIVPKEKSMAQNDTFHPSEARGIHMAVIEYRTNGSNEWVIHSMYDDVNEVEKGYLTRRCGKLANRALDCEFRWRYGLLTLDPSDNCETFKSE